MLDKNSHDSLPAPVNLPRSLHQDLGDMDRIIRNHMDMTVIGRSRLELYRDKHVRSICKAISTLGRAFSNTKVYILVEAEISDLQKKAKPEDIVAWIEDVGILVIEVKSHMIDGIRSFENNVPIVMYNGKETEDKDILEQPRDFAYKMKSSLENLFEINDLELPSLYFAGWLPNVSPDDVQRRQQKVARDKIWLSDMVDKNVFLSRITEMKNLTRSNNNTRESLELFCKIFGSTSGLRHNQIFHNAEFGSLGHEIDRKNSQLKRLTKEQEDLAFNPMLTRGPKVIRGVAGSGKTIVLANAVAETLLRDPTSNFRILVLCYNRSLVNLLSKLIPECFEVRKHRSDLSYRSGNIHVTNISKLAYSLSGPNGFNLNDIRETVSFILKKDTIKPYDFCFIDEGQDIDNDWYPMIRALTKDHAEVGRSIVVFYDDAQNLYGIRRPGTLQEPAWTQLFGADPNPRGLKTVMRVGHRNTNQVLSFSFAMLLGNYANKDPQMATFAGLNEYTGKYIPDDPSIDHPKAGLPCVEKIDKRLYKINFSIHDGSPPKIYSLENENIMVDELVRSIRAILSPNEESSGWQPNKQGNVQPSDVLVMVPEQKQAIYLGKALEAVGIKVHFPFKSASLGLDNRDQGCFCDGRVTVSPIKSCKGYTAHVCHLAYAHSLPIFDESLRKAQQARAEFHVACTRSSLILNVWGVPSLLMTEAQQASDVVAKMV